MTLLLVYHPSVVSFAWHALHSPGLYLVCLITVIHSTSEQQYLGLTACHIQKHSISNCSIPLSSTVILAIEALAIEALAIEALAPSSTKGFGPKHVDCCKMADAEGQLHRTMLVNRYGCQPLTFHFGCGVFCRPISHH